MKLNTNLAKKSIKTKSGLNHAKVDIIPENVAKNTKPNCFIFDIDNSGSMNELVSYDNRNESISKIDYAKNAILKFVNKLGPNDMVGIISFNNFATIEQPLTEVTENNLKTISNNIKRMRANGGTNIEDSLNMSLDMLSSIDKTAYSTKVILFSDGQANVGINSSTGLGKIASRMFEENVTVTTIGIGLGYDSEVMGAIATNGNGGMYHLENFDKFDDILRDEFESTSSIVATNVKLKISDFGLIQICENINKYEQTEVDGVIEINIGNIIRDKSLALEFKNDFETTKQNIKLELSYIDLDGKKQGIIDYLEMNVSDIEDKEENEDVIKYIKVILNANIMTRASGMYDSGNISGSVNTMNMYRDNLTSLQANYCSVDVNDDLMECESVTNSFREEKLSRSANKLMFAKSMNKRRE